MTEALESDMPSQDTESSTTLPELSENPSTTLPWDILLTIVSFASSTTDLFRLMRTCRILYTAGLRSYLVQSQVRATADDMESFCDFALKTPDRPGYIHSLHIVGLASLQLSKSIGRSQAITSSLVRLISNAWQLRMLRIEALEDLIKVDGRFSRAITNLTNLTSAHFFGIGHHGATAIRAMRSRMHEAWFEFELLLGEDSEAAQVPSMLAKLEERLEKLRLTRVRSLHAVPGFRYPRIRSLELDLSYYRDFTTLDDLSYTFPDLTHLIMKPTDEWDDPDAYSDDEIEHLRRQSYGPGKQFHWTSLDVVDVPLSWAYLLGLRCPVRLWRGGWLHREADILWFQACVADIQPVHLQISISPPGPVEKISTIFPTCNITHLNVVIIPKSYTTISMPDLFENLALSFRKLKLSFLMLDVGLKHIHGSESRSIYYSHTWMDIPNYARRLFDHLSLLQYVSIRFIYGEKPNQHFTWTFKGSRLVNGPCAIENIPFHECMQVLERTIANWERFLA